MAYNAPRYFPPAYFGGAAEYPGQIIDLAADLDGTSTFSATLDLVDNNIQPMQPVFFRPGSIRLPARPVALSVKLTGAGSLVPRLSLAVSLSGQSAGSGTLSGSIATTINFRRRRRNEEEVLAAWLLAA